MSYCRKEGKDVIIFVTEEDQAQPSSVTLLPEDPGDLDTSNQGAILPNGEINWDCPCLGNLPNGPCGPAFREAFSCWAENKNDQEAFASKCFENFTEWELCLSEHRDIYKSEKRDEEEENKDSSEKSRAVLDDTEKKSLESTVPLSDEDVQTVKSPHVDTRPAIAAAFVDEKE